MDVRVVILYNIFEVFKTGQNLFFNENQIKITPGFQKVNIRMRTNVCHNHSTVELRPHQFFYFSVGFLELIIKFPLTFLQKFKRKGFSFEKSALQ